MSVTFEVPRSRVRAPSVRVVSGGNAPDLRESPIPTNRAAFKDVVVNGAKLPTGMPQYRDFTDQQIDGLMHYIRQQARKALAVAKK